MELGTVNGIFYNGFKAFSLRFFYFHNQRMQIVYQYHNSFSLHILDLLYFYIVRIIQVQAVFELKRTSSLGNRILTFTP